MDKILERVFAQFSPASVGEAVAGFLPDLIVALLSFFLIFIIWKAVDRGSQVFFERAGVDPTATTFVRTLVKYALLTVAGVTALDHIGINTTSIIASLGIVGLTIGFAARDALSNTISGLFIFWDRPFVIGDLVEIGDNYGRVENITMRSTRVVTTDGRMLAIPNTTVVNTVVSSYTNFPNLRLDLEFTVGVDEDLEQVREILLGVIADDPGVLGTPPPQVVTKALGDYNITMELRVWINDESQHIAKRFAIQERAYLALYRAKVDMPYETVNITPLEVRKQAG
jgi:small conductance mechanosensitive channel